MGGLYPPREAKQAHYGGLYPPREAKTGTFRRVLHTQGG